MISMDAANALLSADDFLALADACAQADEIALIRARGLDKAAYLRVKRHAEGLPRYSRRELLAYWDAFEAAEIARANARAKAADCTARMTWAR